MMSAMSGMSGMSAMSGSGGATTDPATDPDVTVVLDWEDGVVTGLGVSSLPSAVAGSLDLEQTTDAQRPAKGADHIAGDGSADKLVGVAGVEYSDLYTDTGGYVLLFGLKTPASIGTDNGPTTGYLNESYLSDSGGNVSTWLRSTGPELGYVYFSGGWDSVTMTVALSTYYTVAVRFDGSSTLGLSTDGITWEEKATASTGDTSGRTVKLFANYNAAAHTAGKLSYVAALNATKTDAEVQARLAWIAANKPIA